MLSPGRRSRMEGKLFAAIAALFLALSASPHAARAFNEVPSAQEAGFDRIRERDLRANLYFLASDSLRGRKSLDPVDAVVAEWVASEFAKAGIEPLSKTAGGDPSYLQAIELVEYQPDPEASFLSLERVNDSKKWSSPDVVGGFREELTISAPLAFAGYGITAPAINYDDYRGLDARGKVVLIFDDEPQENDPHSLFNGNGNTRHATRA